MSTCLAVEKIMENYLTITPLGGLGEIGLNCQLWETGKGMIMIDCGLMFPDDYHLGIDVVIPRFEKVVEAKEDLLAVVITHGHEDHIGALPWLVPHFKKLKIYATPFSLALIEHKLTERDLIDRVELCPVNPYDKIKEGDFNITFYPVCHSIPQASALGIETPLGKIFHTGDFKFDYATNSCPAVTYNELREFAKDGVRLLLSDSTNVESEGYSRPEIDVKDGLTKVFEDTKGRIIITLFSSNIDRIRTVFELAEQFGKNVVVSGRSLNANIEKACNLDMLELPKNIYSDYEALPYLDPENTVIIATGSQGEPLSALNRIANGYHKQLSLQEGDCVIMSSRVIPGNAKAVARLINQIYKLGAKVYDNKDYCVHATGHAYKNELDDLLKIMKPEHFIPVHGEYRHLVKHADLARENGIPKENIAILEDGSPFTLLEEGFRLEEPILAEQVLVDGKGVGDVGRSVLKERRILGGEGLVVVLLIMSEESGEVLHGPEIFSRGFVFEQRYDHVLEDSKCLVLDVLESSTNYNLNKLEEKIRILLRSFFREVLQRDPIIIPIITIV